jgi:hypothetical protein
MKLLVPGLERTPSANADINRTLKVDEQAPK